MVTASRPGPTPFSLSQLKTLMAWGARRPQGFAVRVMTDHEDYPELAELYTHDRMSPLWFLNATEAGTAVITNASAAGQELGTVEEALAQVLELERPGPDAAWPVRARAQRGGHRPRHSHGS